MVVTPIERSLVILRSILGACGICLTLISASVLISYAIEIWHTGSIAALYRTEMAPATAMCFLIGGVALIAIAILWKRDRHGGDGDA